MIYNKLTKKRCKILSWLFRYYFYIWPKFWIRALNMVYATRRCCTMVNEDERGFSISTKWRGLAAVMLIIYWADVPLSISQFISPSKTISSNVALEIKLDKQLTRWCCFCLLSNVLQSQFKSLFKRTCLK